MKTLYLDFENGYKSLGSKDDIEKLFGYPVLQYETWHDFKVLLGQLFTKSAVKETVKVGTIDISQEVIKWKKKDGVELDCLVLDTMTELVKKYQRELAGAQKKLQLQDWGKMKLELDTCLAIINSVPVTVICNVHGKLKEDSENNVLKVMPNIEGSTKEDLGKWFDFVLYTKVVKNAKGERSYVWITARDEKYCQAKDRSQELPEQMPQDYSIIMNIIKKRGWEGAKILIIGDPGSGKTLSLNTLK